MVSARVAVGGIAEALDVNAVFVKIRQFGDELADEDAERLRGLVVGAKVLKPASLRRVPVALVVVQTSLRQLDTRGAARLRSGDEKRDEKKPHLKLVGAETGEDVG
jgi:hypothetical protein